MTPATRNTLCALVASLSILGWAAACLYAMLFNTLDAALVAVGFFVAAASAAMLMVEETYD